MDIFWSGPGDEVTIEIPLVSVGSAIIIRSYEPATGTVRLNWNGVFMLLLVACTILLFCVHEFSPHPPTISETHMSKLPASFCPKLRLNFIYKSSKIV